MIFHFYMRLSHKLCTTQQFGRSRVRFPMVSLQFFIDIILPAALWPWGDSASNRKEYQEYFLSGKGGRCVRLTTLPPSCADCLEIWEPQPTGTLRACPGVYRVCFTFPFTLVKSNLLKPYLHFSTPPYVPHGQPNIFSFISSTNFCFARRTNYQASRYVNICSLFLLLPFYC